MEHHDARTCKGSLVDGTMNLIVAEVIEPDVRAFWSHFDSSAAPQRSQEHRGIVGHAGARRGQRRLKTNRHGFFRLPNRAVPTRMCVAPSSMATSKSCDIPMDTSGRPNC